MKLRQYPNQPHPIKDIITGIIARHGGRLGGSKQEEAAQLELAQRLEAHGAGRVTVQRFRTALWAMFQCLLPAVVLYVLSVAAWPLLWSGLEAALLATAASVLFLTEFVFYRRWLDFLFPKQSSLNVIADAEPAGEVRRTVIFAGHIDSSREFFWWYRLKGFALVLMFIIGIMMGIVWPVSTWLYVFDRTIDSPFYPALSYIFWAAVATLPLTLVFVFIRAGKAVPGAMDNLSGIATSLAAFETLTPGGRSLLEHTRLRFISFGSEEAGLRGAEAYAKAYKAQLHAEKAVLVNVDSILNDDELNVMTREIMPMVKFDPQHVAQVEQAFKAAGVPYTREVVPIGGSDAVCLQRIGIPSTTLVGFSTKGLHPVYHTRLDVPEYLDPKALDDIHNVLVTFARQADAQA